jgi:hypothetical protein
MTHIRRDAQYWSHVSAAGHIFRAHSSGQLRSEYAAAPRAAALAVFLEPRYRSRFSSLSVNEVEGLFFG